MAKNSGRIELYALLRRDLGDDTAAALMQALLSPTDWDDLARRSDIKSLRAEVGGVDGRVTGLDRRLTSVEGRLTSVEGRLTGVEGRLTGVETGLREVQGSLLDLRATMIEMKGAIEAQVPKFLRANILTAFAASGVVLAAVKL